VSHGTEYYQTEKLTKDVAITQPQKYLHELRSFAIGQQEAIAVWRSGILRASGI